MRNKHGRLISTNGHELIYQAVHDVPIITVENYPKWYTFYIINPDDSVSEANQEIINDILDEEREGLVIDHIFHPKLLLEYAKKIGGEVEEVSLELVTGRWMLQREQPVPTLENIKVEI